MINVKYEKKIINLNNIDNSCLDSTQARIGDIDDKYVRELERSIELKGLIEPISVEELNVDAVNPGHSTYILRDGSHRFQAYKNLQNKHNKSGGKYDRIVCVVYETNRDANADYQWLEWQIRANFHLEKIHRKASIEDIVAAAYELLTKGYLCEKAMKNIKSKNWDHDSIELALRAWLKKECAHFTHAQRDKIIELTIAKGGHIFKSKIKRYSRNELKDILEEEFRVPSSGGISQDGSNVRVWGASGTDYWTKAAAPIVKLCQAKKKEAHNIIVFHSKSTNLDIIDRERNSLVSLVKDINTYFAQNVPGFKHIKLIDEVKFLGQKLKLGEKANQLT